LWLAYAVAAVAACVGACRAAPQESVAPPVPAVPVPEVVGYEVVREYPHDPEAFTQGLIYKDGFLYESTGLTGRSSLRRVRLETGEVLQRADVTGEHFAEGLADWGTELIQLTWVSNVAFVYDRGSFRETRRFTYAGEGWGLTHDGTRLIMSDGTANLRWLNPADFRELSRFTVRDDRGSIDDLNELEYVRGSIYANIWMTDRIAVIDPATGHVTTWVDLAGLRPGGGDAREDVLNGIAYDAAGDRLFVTGKLWSKLFEIRLKAR
jgi:glutamine cyclotransferase